MGCSSVGVACAPATLDVSDTLRQTLDHQSTLLAEMENERTNLAAEVNSLRDELASTESTAVATA